MKQGAIEDSLRESLLNQIIELQNANDALSARLFSERQKSIQTITQSFQKSRLERQRDADMIQDLQAHLSQAENDKESLQRDLDKARQLCGFAHNKLVQQQLAVNNYIENGERLQRGIDSLTAENEQLKLALEVAELQKSAGAESPAECAVCAEVAALCGAPLPAARLCALLRQALDRDRSDMSCQTEAVVRQTRFAQTDDLASSGPATTRAPSLADSPWDSPAAGNHECSQLEDGEIVLNAMEQEILLKTKPPLPKRRRRRPVAS